MGKSRKTSNVAATKEAKKDKRCAEKAPEKWVSSKKEKIRTLQVDQDKKKVKKLTKDLIESLVGKKDDCKKSDFEVRVAAAPVSVPQTKEAKKDKRCAEEAPNEQVSSKKQKIETLQVDQKKKKVTKLTKALIESLEGKKDDSKSSDFEKRETDNQLRDSFGDVAKNKEISEISEKEPEMPAKQNEESSTKRLFVGNLPAEVVKDDLLEFFKKSGEVTEVRLATKEDGSFRGFGHVEFVTETGAQEGLRMNGHMLLGCPLIVDSARERGSNVPMKGHSVYVKGFGKSLEENQIRSLLKEHFGAYGKIIRVSIPQDNKTGRSKGFAYLLFNDQATASKALELNGTELGGYNLTVQEPMPKSVPGDGSYIGRRGRGPGASYERSATTTSKGKKTIFGDND